MWVGSQTCLACGWGSARASATHGSAWYLVCKAQYDGSSAPACLFRGAPLVDGCVDAFPMCIGLPPPCTSHAARRNSPNTMLNTWHGPTNEGALCCWTFAPCCHCQSHRPVARPVGRAPSSRRGAGSPAPGRECHREHTSELMSSPVCLDSSPIAMPS